MRSNFGPRRLRAEEKYVTVMSTVAGCDVTNCATTLHGFNKHASSHREVVSDSRSVPRCTDFFSNQRMLTCVDRSSNQSYSYPEFSSHSSPLYHLPGELVSLSSVPMPSIDLNLWNRSRPSAFVPMSLGFTSVLADDIVKSFRKTKS